MSWDAELTVDRTGESIGEWNSTHNTNRMIAWALDDIDRAWTFPLTVEPTPRRKRPPWWWALDDLNGAEGARLLSGVIGDMEANIEVFREMNPDNGWGDADSLVSVLRSMLAACLTEEPTTWNLWG